MIYFIRTRHAVKIGYTASAAEARLATLQTGNHEDLTLVATCEGSVEDEAAIHDELSAYWMRGEWFHLSMPVRRLIRQKTGVRVWPAPPTLIDLATHIGPLCLVASAFHPANADSHIVQAVGIFGGFGAAVWFSCDKLSQCSKLLQR